MLHVSQRTRQRRLLAEVWGGAMQPGPAERSRRSERSRSAGPRGNEPGSWVRSAEDPKTTRKSCRFKETVVTSEPCKEKKRRDGGGRGESRREEDKEERGRGGAKEGEQADAQRRSEEDGSEELRRLRWRVNQLDKEKLQLTSSSNEEVCVLQAELTRLRAEVERAEAQRAELRYQRAVAQRDAERIANLSREKQSLTERVEELQQNAEELKKVLHMTRRAREQDQHALQREVEERDQLIGNFSSENQRLHTLLQEQGEALEETQRRMVEVQSEREKEAKLITQQTEELRYLTEKEETSRREKELLDQRLKALEASVEAERAAGLEAKFTCEVVQLRLKDLEAAVAVERSGQQEAQRGLEQLRAQSREAELALGLERERGGGAERALQRLQAELAQSQADLRVATETRKKATSDLTQSLEEERRRHANTTSLLEEASRRRSAAEEALLSVRTQIRDLLARGRSSPPPAEEDGSPGEVLLLRTAARRLETGSRRVRDLTAATQKLRDENRALQRASWDQTRRIQEFQQELAELQKKLMQVHQEASDWSAQKNELQAELQKEKEDRQREREEQQEQRAQELHKMAELHSRESKEHLTSLHCIYQRLLAGCVLLDQPQSILGDFTWKELCEVIKEQVEVLTTDLQKTQEKVTHLKGVCRRRSVCLQELRRRQECVLSHLEESMRTREEARRKEHTHTVEQLQSELQLCRSHVQSLFGQSSSLEQRCSSLTSELSHLQDLLSQSHRESSSFSSACALLGGALRHAHHRLHALAEQKNFLSKRLAGREVLEEEVQRLADALEVEKSDKEEEQKERRRRAARRWRSSVGLVVALRRWCAVSRRSSVVLRLDGGVGVCAALPAATEAEQEAAAGGTHEAVCARLLGCRRLSSVVLSATSDLQAALACTGPAPPNVVSAARSALSRLLHHLLDQSESSVSSGGAGEVKTTPPETGTKTVVSALQQHFLLYSQRLHSAEVERRGLRLQLTNLRRGLKEREEMVSGERFHAACEELRQALSREQEAQALVQQQGAELRRRADAHNGERSRHAEELAEARQQAGRLERSLRILGKHLSGVQKERRRLEERLRRAEEELDAAGRRLDCFIRCMKTAETSCKQVKDELVQSQPSMSAEPRPLSLPKEHLELSGAESIMGGPEVEACQSFLSVVSQLRQACSTRILWLQQEVSAHRSHITALRGELQEACLRDNQVFVPIEDFPGVSPFNVEKKKVLLCDTRH